MGQIGPLHYRPGKGQIVYYGLTEWLNVRRDKFDRPTNTWVPKTPAEIKADADQALRLHVWERIRNVIKRDRTRAAEKAFDEDMTEVPDVLDRE